MSDKPERDRRLQWPKENLIVAVALLEQANELLMQSRMAEFFPEHKAVRNLQARAANLLGVAREVKQQVLAMPERP